MNALHERHRLGMTLLQPRARPGGFQPHEVMRFIRRLAMHGAAAMDVVEYAPLIDTTRNTGNLLATLLCEFMAGRSHYLAKR